MDASKIVVLVFTAIAVGFLVWIELKSRRNSRAQQSESATSVQEPQQQSAKQR